MGAQQGKEFPYDIGPVNSSFQGRTFWTLLKGTVKESGKTVSIFSFDLKANNSEKTLSAVRAAFKRIKSLRHPNIITFVDGVETETNIYIVTEEVRPLNEVLDEYRRMKGDRGAISWGIYSVAKALGFLTNDCKLMHGNVVPTSIFVNRAGDWKLSGFELTCGINEIDPVYKAANSLVPDKYKPPEVIREQWSALLRGNSWAIDSWALGCVINEVFNGQFTKVEDLKNIAKIPKELLPQYQKLLFSSSSGRLNPNDLLESPYFQQSQLVSMCLFLDNIALKDDAEKDEFFRSLPEKIGDLPADCLVYRVLPPLIQALDFGTGNARVFPSVIRIGAMMPPEEFVNTVVPSIVKWYTSPDRALRIYLLQHLGEYHQHLNANVVADKIFPQVCNGFTDTSPMLRELTVKCMLYLVPKIPQRLVHNTLLRFFAKLQVDPEPGIRTNTTICLGKISPYMTDATRQRVLVPAFTRALKDPFPPARSASLMSIVATAEAYTPQDYALRILPAVAPLLIDPEGDVRACAFQCTDAVMKKLKEASEEMPATERKEGYGTLPNSGGAAGDKATGDSANDASSDSVSVKLLSSTGNMLGWAMGAAVNSLSKRVYGDGTSPEPNPSPPSSTKGTTPPTTTTTQPTRPSASQPPAAHVSAPAAKPSSSMVDVAAIEDDVGGWDESDPFADNDKKKNRGKELDDDDAPWEALEELEDNKPPSTAPMRPLPAQQPSRPLTGGMSLSKSSSLTSTSTPTTTSFSSSSAATPAAKPLSLSKPTTPSVNPTPSKPSPTATTAPTLPTPPKPTLPVGASLAGRVPPTSPPQPQRPAPPPTLPQSKSIPSGLPMPMPMSHQKPPAKTSSAKDEWEAFLNDDKPAAKGRR